MSKDKAPRLFELQISADGTVAHFKQDKKTMVAPFERIMLVEKSAYDELKREMLDVVTVSCEHVKRVDAEKQALEAKLAECVAALEKCANPASYHAPCLSCGPKIAENGSYIAREVLSKVKK